MNPPFVAPLGFSLLACLCRALIGLAASSQEQRLAHRVLAAPLLVLFGRYSYGLYAFHHPLLFFTPKTITHAALPTFLGSALPARLGIIGLGIGVTLGMAMLSWHAYEKRFLKLKRFFSYRSTPGHRVMRSPEVAHAAREEPLQPCLDPFGRSDAEGERHGVQPRVSVVMPVYNGAEYLEQAIESILNQTLQELELLVIDDGSTDGTVALLQRYARVDPRVRVVRQNHSGLVAALNRGAELARAPYLARMDADDIAFPDRLAKQVRFLDENAGVALVGGPTVRISSEGRRIKTISLPTAPDEIATRLFAGEICIIHPTVVMRVDAFVAVGGYRAAFVEGAEDGDLWLRMSERFELANLPDPVLAYRIHPAQYSEGHLQQLVIGFLAAQAAARLRRATGQDPIAAGEPQVTLATLQRLGVGDDLVCSHLIEAYRRNFRVFLEVGNVEGAIRLFRESTVSWKVKRALRTDYALALLRQAKRQYAERQAIQGSLSVLRACLVRPSLPLTKLAARARSAVAS